MFFKSQAHRDSFVTALQGINKVWDGKIDQEYGAALYILLADAGIWDRTSDYVSRNGIRFEEMIEEVDFSGGYRVLIKLAGNLFNGHLHVDPVDLMRLDESNFQVALTALELRRHALPLSSLVE